MYHRNAMGFFGPFKTPMPITPLPAPQTGAAAAGAPPAGFGAA